MYFQINLFRVWGSYSPSYESQVLDNSCHLGHTPFHQLRVNNNSSPTERTRHVHIQYFSLQDWQQDGDLIMVHIPGIVNLSNSLSEPVGFVLYS